MAFDPVYIGPITRTLPSGKTTGSEIRVEADDDQPQGLALGMYNFQTGGEHSTMRLTLAETETLRDALTAFLDGQR